MATSATNLLLRYSYPKVPGDQLHSMLDVTGPAAYVELTPGSPGPPVTPPTGGQLITAQDFGLQALDFVVASGSFDGLYTGIVIPLGGTLLAPAPFEGDDFVAFLLMWMSLAPGTPEEEPPASTDLSASRMRLYAIGR